MPFGKHRGQPLRDIPTSYLRWLVGGVKLSSGLRLAVAEELQRRGVEVGLPPSQPFPVRACDRCPAAGVAFGWAEDSLGRKRVRASCTVCDCLLAIPPSRPPYSTLADIAASASPMLDVLLACEAAGVELASDGRKVWLVGDGWKKLSPEMKAKLRECSHQLAGMIGNNLAEMAP
jgi:uncharacterized protein (DUF3820 family)